MHTICVLNAPHIVPTTLERLKVGSTHHFPFIRQALLEHSVHIQGRQIARAIPEHITNTHVYIAGRYGGGYICIWPIHQSVPQVSDLVVWHKIFNRFPCLLKQQLLIAKPVSRLFRSRGVCCIMNTEILNQARKPQHYQHSHFLTSYKKEELM